jgi:hypothetical protein
VTVIWNGTVVTGPVLIYQDELVVYDGAIPPPSSLDGPGSHTLFCRSTTSAGVAWHLANGTIINPTSSTAFHQRTTGPGVIPSESALVHYVNITVSSDSHNGLWTCQLNGTFTGSFPVGVYQRGNGETVLQLHWNGPMNMHLICLFHFQLVALSPQTKCPSPPPHF